MEKAVEDEEMIIGLSCFLFKPDYVLPVRPWKQDGLFGRHVLAAWDDVVLGLHPMSLGFYILARNALREGKRERANQILADMSGEWVGKIWSMNLIKSTKALVQAAELEYSQLNYG